MVCHQRILSSLLDFDFGGHCLETPLGQKLLPRVFLYFHAHSGIGFHEDSLAILSLACLGTGSSQAERLFRGVA